jgi:hypothetical protein
MKERAWCERTIRQSIGLFFFSNPPCVPPQKTKQRSTINMSQILYPLLSALQKGENLMLGNYYLEQNIILTYCVGTEKHELETKMSRRNKQASKQAKLTARNYYCLSPTPLHT